MMQINDVVKLLRLQVCDHLTKVVIEHMHPGNIRVICHQIFKMRFGKVMYFGLGQLFLNTPYNRCGEYNISNGTKAYNEYFQIRAFRWAKYAEISSRFMALKHISLVRNPFRATYIP